MDKVSQFYQGTTAGNLPPSVPTSFVTDNGTAIPASHVININGGPGIEVIANLTGSNNILIELTDIAPVYTNVNFGMSPYTVTATDYFISVDASGGPVIIDLPVSTTTNRQFIIKDRLGQANTNNITVQSGGGTTIDGQTQYTFVDNYESLECLYHNLNYEIF